MVDPTAFQKMKLPDPISTVAGVLNEDWPCAGARKHNQGVRWPQRPRQDVSTEDTLRFRVQTTQL